MIIAKTIPVETLDAQRAYGLTRAALTEAYDEHLRRTRKDNPETCFTHYFNSAKQRELHQHRSAFDAYLKSLDGKDISVQNDAINGIIQAWDKTLPNQLVTIVSQLSDILNQKWYHGVHEASLMDAVDEIAYCVEFHKNDVAARLLRSALNPYQRLSYSGTQVLEHVARKAYAEANRDMVQGRQRELKVLPALRA